MLIINSGEKDEKNKPTNKTSLWGKKKKEKKWNKKSPEGRRECLLFSILYLRK